MSVKYVVHPDYVISKIDRDRHYIGAARLMQLYGVPPNECVVDKGEPSLRGLEKDLIHLWPSYSGNYSLPKGEKSK